MASLGLSLLAELIGTFALVFIGAGTAALGLGGVVGIALAHGLVVVGFAYAYGRVSGTHINPAVTFGVWLAGLMETKRAAAYCLVQLLGGLFGGLALYWLLGGAETGLGVTVLAEGLEAGGTTITISPLQGLVLEVVLTFFLVTAVLNAGLHGKATAVGGLAIGLTLVFCILLGAPLTGASLNPARTLGPAVATGIYDDFWVYWVGPLVGGALGGWLYKGWFAKAE